MNGKLLFIEMWLQKKTIRIKVLLLLFDLFHLNTFYRVYLSVLTKSSIQPSINTNKYSIIWLFLFQGANSIIENSSRVNKQQNMINTRFVPEPLQTSIKLRNVGEYLYKFLYFSNTILQLLIFLYNKWKIHLKKNSNFFQLKTYQNNLTLQDFLQTSLYDYNI